jgi:hypothetical protein
LINHYQTFDKNLDLKPYKYPLKIQRKNGEKGVKREQKSIDKKALSVNIQEPSTRISSTMRESNKHRKERIKGQ